MPFLESVKQRHTAIKKHGAVTGYAGCKLDCKATAKHVTLRHITSKFA